MLRCGLIGCGTVGSGVVRLWHEPGHAPAADLAVVAVRDPHERRGVELASYRITTDARSVAADPSIDLVIEATGDTALGRELALACFRQGKAFVTAGKALVAEHGPELSSAASRTGAPFGFEATVAGAVPVVSLVRDGLLPGPVRGIAAVLNGTCNYMLSRLAEGVAFDDALARARERGFAEADPRRDLSGRDTADKLTILARLCGLALDTARLDVRGIEGIGPDDVAPGRRVGLTLRLVARLTTTGGIARGRVRPEWVAVGDVLAAARGEENVVVFDVDGAGPVALHGRGAGALPTAAAILTDVRRALAGRGPAGAPASHPTPREEERWLASGI